MRLVIAVMLACGLAQTASAATGGSMSMWTGAWHLDPQRAEPDGAAPDYKFSIAGQTIVWEIPSLGEVNHGKLDGTPFPILRRGHQTGKMLSVRQAGPRTLRYTVLANGVPKGSGEMTLAANGRSWTDVPLNGDVPVSRLTMVYVRQ